MSRITLNSNIAALTANRRLGESTTALRTSFERLSSGLRINRPSDVAAGLAVASSLHVDARVYAQGVRNLSDGISLLDVADGAAGELANILLRLEELSTQAASGALAGSQRQALDREAQALVGEYNRIRETTRFNGISLLSGAGTLSLQGGYGSQATLQVVLGQEAILASSLPGIARVSVDSSGNAGNGHSFSSFLNDDGRYVSYWSVATNLVAGDTNGLQDVFVHDRQTGQTTRVNVDSSGNEANGTSDSPLISGDGRYVVFWSAATNLVAGDTNGLQDVFIHDRQTGQTTRLSVDSSGNQATGGNSNNPRPSSDGRYVVFQSAATNLIPGDTNGVTDIFIHDRQTGQTSRLSVDGSGNQATGGNSVNPYLSSDGRYVAFESAATNLVQGDTNGLTDIFVHDRQTGQTTRVSVDSAGNQATGGTTTQPSISNDGRYVMFQSSATNLVAGDTNGVTDIFVHDRQTGQTTRVSVDSSGNQGNGASTTTVQSISGDGRYIVFQSSATNLVAGDTNGVTDVFVHDQQTGQTARLSVNAEGIEANGQSVSPRISTDGRFITFRSVASNLIDGDTNGVSDIFVTANPFYETAGESVTLAPLSTLSGIDISTRDAALSTLDTLGGFLDQTRVLRGRIGAAQSRLAVASETLRISSESFRAAESRIVDADVAEESAGLVRNRILQQAGAAILTQANQLPALALELLR